MVGQGGAGHAQRLLNLTHRRALGPGLDQVSKYRQPGRITQFSQSFYGVFVLHFWKITPTIGVVNYYSSIIEIYPRHYPPD